MSPSSGHPIGERFAGDEGSAEALHGDLTAFVGEVVAEAGADGVVVNLGGGVDSTVAATLAVDALGADRVYGLSLPCNLGTEAARRDDLAVTNALGIDHGDIHIQPLLDAFVDRVTPGFETSDESVALGNVTARLRMACAYFVANTTSRLVLGTGNRTELLLGYFTKYGDGGVDLLPLGDLYGTEVRTLARYLGVPEFIVEKPPTAGLRAGRSDEADLGAPCGTIDRVLHRLVDHDLGIDRVASDLGLDRELVRRIAWRHATSRHKRARPPTPAGRDGRTRDEYFHDLELRFP